jgi:hypothetical protein
MPHKEGLEAALDFTKVLTALSGAAIGFLLDQSHHIEQGVLWIKVADTASIVLFSLSVLGGLGVLTRGAKLMGQARYELGEKRLASAGAMNVGGFAVATLILSIELLVRIWVQ